MATSKDWGPWSNLMPPGQGETEVSTFPANPGVKVESFSTRRKKEVGSQPMDRKNQEIASLREFIKAKEY